MFLISISPADLILLISTDEEESEGDCPDLNDIQNKNDIAQIQQISVIFLGENSLFSVYLKDDEEDNR